MAAVTCDCDCSAVVSEVLCGVIRSSCEHRSTLYWLYVTRFLFVNYTIIHIVYSIYYVVVYHSIIVDSRSMYVYSVYFRFQILDFNYIVMTAA